MSTTVDQAFVKQYEAEVHAAYQRQGSKLMNTCRVKPVTNAKDCTFQKVGRGSATTKARHGLVPVMNLDHTNVTATLADYYAGEWVDKLDELKTNIDERGVVANAGAYALGRTTDTIITTALGTMATSTVTMGVSSIAAFKNKILEAIEKLNNLDVPDDGERWGVVSSRFWSWLMLVDEFVRADYIGGDALPYKSGFTQIKNWCGVKWMPFTGISGAGGATANNLLYHKSCIGLAVGQHVSADITWHGDRASHFISHSMSFGSVLIDGEGGCEMVLDETAALAAS